MNDDSIPRPTLPAVNPAIAAFRHELFAQTPRVWVTPLLVGINAAVFIGMVVSGVDAMNPAIDSLIRWGANYGPRTTSGEWWRLLTNVFLHIGIVHIAMNMFGLWQIGLLVERLLGNRGFLVAYLVSGLCGSAASLFWNPYVVSAGASGAVFGVYGLLVAYLLRNRGFIPREILQPLQKNALFFIGINVLLGLRIKGIDMAAHIGGLLGGFACGLLVLRPRATSLATPPLRRVLLLAGAGLALVGATAALAPKVVDLQAALSDLRAAEHEIVSLYNGALERRQADKLSDDDLASLIETQMLPPWRDQQRRLRSLPHLRGAQQKRVDDIGAYLALREQAWSTLGRALHTGDSALAKQSQDLQRQATEAVKAIEGQN